MFKLFSATLVTLLIPALGWSANLSASSPHETVPFETSFQLRVSGGVSPYRYQVTYGAATVSASGKITTGSKNGQVKVLVYDSKNKKVMVRFRVLKTAVLGSAPVPANPEPSPSPAPSPAPAPVAEKLFKVPAQAPKACKWEERIDCESFKYARKIDVRSAAELKTALADLRAGDLVSVASGVYSGLFVITLKASSAAYVCAEKGAVIDGGNYKSGYGLYLNKASNIVVSGLAVRNVQKGVMMDGGQNLVLHNMTVSGVGDEAVHFRNNTQNSVISRSKILDAGLYQPDFGEGVYLGSSKNKWCPSGTNCGEPDRSDCNLVSENYISNVKAESIDVKEGTQNNVIAENEFEGSGMTGAYADSFIDVKGNLTYVLNNKGVAGQCGSKSCQLNGFQTHIAVAGWGDKNVFSGNRLSGDFAGPVVGLQKALSNVVHCDNTADNGVAAANAVCVNP
ncbi:hypothetical protein AZI86_00810 [Bdellovibrio bacteriovorus]|uniref:Right handed beta helix domain-containing protein n=1 Tax=Bdellovibrio bacteriovorus TaxID=959 RepID=A0A150WMK9_BDEBC|nr:right-handed parallel beta-helix repeat-containing protein [Bdellovibrio bacteriovorus]KYG65650.1 hypothetical protein AZI86_00810 [Bdellovibrio bacteriovorus]